MALSKTVNLGSIEVKDAYKRVDQVNYKGNVHVVVNTYGTKADAEAGELPILPAEKHDFSIEDCGGKEGFSIAKVYELVKATPENEGAVDA